MIIKDASRQKRSNAITYLLIGLTACIGILIWLLQQDTTTNDTYRQLSSEGIYCSAETVKDSQFVNGNHNFGSAVYQSEAAARTGIYSCRLPASKKAVFGFGYTLENPPGGKSYKASVWRKKGISTSSYLAVSMEGESPIYLQANNSVSNDTLGWEKLEIRFSTPYQTPPDKIKVYVYSTGQNEVFFDDLLIEPLFADTNRAFIPTVLNLEVGADALEQLEEKRQQALKKGILTSSDDDWVKASLQENDQPELAVEIRLKGDWLDHLRSNKWSFRIKLKSGNTWRRMRSFSLHTPMARHFLSEWVLHKFWEKEGVLTTRYDFVELKLNGKSLGVYAYEEHFEKQLVEYRQRREGPILKLSEGAYWESIERQLQQHGFIAPIENQPTANWEKATIEAFKENTIQENPVLAQQYEQARSLLYQYQNGSTTASQIFDVEITAKYYAISDIMNGYHGVVWHNQRFYYNPVTSLLEPIGFDGFGGPPEKKYSILGAGALHPTLSDGDQIFSSLMMDTLFAQRYIQELNRLSKERYIQPFLDSIYPLWSARLAFLQTEFNDYKPDLQEVLTEAQFIQSSLLPYNDFSIAAFRQGKALNLENRHILPIRITGFGYQSERMTQSLDTPLILPGAIGRKFLQRVQRDSQINDFSEVRFLEQGAIKQQSPPLFFKLEAPDNASFLFYQVLGIDQTFSSKISTKGVPPAKIPAQKLKQKAILNPSAIYRVENQQIIFPPGKHLIAEDLILPSGYTVVFEAGADLLLEKGVHFISFSPVKAYGTAESPILIHSKKGEGRGFTVLVASARSELKHVYFDGLNTLSKEGWNLTGAVTFYESDVSFHKCAFTNNQCEDGLNIIRSKFDLSNCLISQTSSDGFDADFCKGNIKNSQFLQTTNDGVDCSGSIINITDCTLENNGDKGISVGEESDVTIFNTTIKSAPIALASKDLSVVFVRDLFIESCEQGFVAYQKKPEFGGATIIVESYTAKAVKRLYAISEGSKLQLLGEVVE